MEPKNMKECDKPKSHISSKLHMICISSDNDRHAVNDTFTTPSLLFTALHYFNYTHKLTPYRAVNKQPLSYRISH